MEPGTRMALRHRIAFVLAISMRNVRGKERVKMPELLVVTMQARFKHGDNFKNKGVCWSIEERSIQEQTCLPALYRESQKAIKEGFLKSGLL